MSAVRKSSVGVRVVKALLGTDQPSFVASAAGVSIGWGIMTVFSIIYFSTRPSPPVWQTIGGGIAFGLFIMPFFFMAISRQSSLTGAWEALATLTAALFCPLLMWHLRALGVNGFVMLGGCIAFVVAAFLIARGIVKRHRKRGLDGQPRAKR